MDAKIEKLNINECDGEFESSSEELDDSDLNGFDDEDDEKENYCEVKGLFSEQIFNNVTDMFKYEAEFNKFNLIDVINKHKLDMLSYIKMINYIRQEKPNVEIFHHIYSGKEQAPWNNDKYLKTTIEDDGALQFDIEEDLDVLDIQPKEKLTDKNNNDNCLVISNYEKKLKESEAKIEELVDVVAKLRNLANNLLAKSSTTGADKTHDDSAKIKSEEDEDKEEGEETDSVYINSYSNYSIHLEMLQDKVRTESYMNAILDNKDLFKDKVVLDVGCGSGILSLFAAKAGAKLVIAVDMSNIIDHAIAVARENNYENKIVFLRGKMEEVKLPVDSVDIIISEWMGYFLLFESMLDSVLFARDKYLKPDGVLLPNFFEMHVFGVQDFNHHNRTINYWSDVYGFKMPTLKNAVVRDAQVMVIKPESVVTNMVKFKEIDCSKCTSEEVAKFNVEFSLNVEKDSTLTGLGCSFDCYFNDAQLENKVFFSTSPFSTATHWQQTLFQFENPVDVKKGNTINGKMSCYKNPEYQRSYIVILSVFNNTYKYNVE